MDIYREITDRIITQMEQGIIPWRKPWIARGQAIIYATGKPYSLLNQMLLGRPGEYATFRQIQQEGGYVRKGEKASMIVFWKVMEQEDKETGEQKTIPLLRYYSVFHIAQCEGLAAKHSQPLPQTASTDQNAETIISGYVQRSGVKVEHRQADGAYYQPSTDRVVLPLLAQFAESAAYYSTAFHELVHSTGHNSRLDRSTALAHFGSDDYSKEELVAEIGAAALVNHTGLETSASLRNNAAYIQNWLDVLKGDKRFIVSASSKAEKAVALILGT